MLDLARSCTLATGSPTRASVISPAPSMPSHLHESLVKLLREQPSLAGQLLRTVLGIEIHRRPSLLAEVQRERIVACADVDMLKRWARAAAVATSSEALFADA